jgi:hypothetical protein
MPHDLVFNTVEEVPEGLRHEGMKVSDDGTVKIPVVPKTRLDEFRESNILTSRERDEFKNRADQLSAIVGDDPDAFKAEFEALKDIKKRVDDGDLKVSDDVERVVNERVEAMRGNYEALLAEERGKSKISADRASTLDAEIKNGKIERMITEACLAPASGVRTEAIAEFVRDALDVWTFPKDGSDPKPMRRGSVVYGENGTDPMTPDEWVASLKKGKSHRFKDSSGGGATGSDRPNFGGLSHEEFSRLPARQRLELANKAAGVKRK